MPHPNLKSCDASRSDAGVVLYEEPETCPCAGMGPARSPSSIFSRLLAAESATQRRRAISDIVHELGFDWLECSAFQVNGHTMRPLACCITHADPAWLRRYVAESYFEVDPRLRSALRALAPHRWDIDTLEAADERQRRFVDDLRHTGMRWGLMFSLPGAGSGQRVVFSLLSSASHPADPIAPGVMSGAMALGICLQELHAALRAPPIVPGPDVARPVRDMQHAVLEGVMRGWADKQIARALGLSRHTVDYHLRRLRQRFGVQNRVQLAQEAWLHEHRSSVSRWAATGEGDTDGETGRTIPTDLSEPA